MSEERGDRKRFNSDCPPTFCDFIGENYVMKVIENPVRMPHNNPGFDWECSNGEKIDHKGTCLSFNRRWVFRIVYNNVASRFILSAWENVECSKPTHVWIFQRDQIVRGKRFFRRGTFIVPNDPGSLKELEKYEVTDNIEKLKEVCSRKK